MFVTNWISTTKIQKISEITNFFRHYFLSRTEVILNMLIDPLHSQELWTKVLQEGFLDLELYPATIEDEYLVGTFCLVPIKC